MSRHLKKSYGGVADAKFDSSATLTFTVPDVKLTEEQIDSIRQETVKAALQAVQPYVESSKSGSSGEVGTFQTVPKPDEPFSTFSTFSNFASAAGRNVVGD